ncbi:MAG: HAMP domain-containing sensor histidine kinase [Halopseudomonas sp.]|uniref:sensor histidine kinase n=1 Tax=Halopseudomonas sp. TaxID=2901191 RepID=UPI003001155E
MPQKKAPTKRHISLKLFIVLAFVSLGALLVVGNAMLSLSYFVTGMDSSIGRQMDKVVENYLRDPAMATQLFDDYPITSSWSEQPQVVQAAFSQPPEREGMIHKAMQQQSLIHRPSAIYFALRFTTPSGDRFMSHQVVPGTGPQLLTQQRSSLRTLLWISAGSALLLGLAIWLVMRRVSRPIGALGKWARGLNQHSLQEPAPDFNYPELNDFAELVRNSLTSAQRGLEREQRFLRHTSRELRGPLNEVRDNVELLSRLQAAAEQQVDLRQLQALERIERASETMQQLTETLQWLSQERIDQLPARPMQLDELLHELVDQMRYLLRGKDVDVQLKTDVYSMILAEAPARVVLGNLIRNAFQHSNEGEVKILQLHNCVRVSSRAPDVDAQEDAGYVPGLQLTAQLAGKLGWRYLSTRKDRRHLAELWLQPPHADAAARRG